MGDLGGNNANGDNQSSIPFKFAKKVAKTLCTRELENLMDFLQQEIDKRNRLIQYERVPQENAPLYELWKRKRIARDVRKARERGERDEGRRFFGERTAVQLKVGDLEEENEDDEGSEDAGDGGYGSANETGSQYSNDYSDDEMGIDDDDDDSSQHINENNGDDSE
ncbi:ATP-dependent RNA helicase drs1-like [Papaver somniferum]|uniref:ATP-dependent RNA helicase drs1-like n=1 Tax=Papaver somniferum TaxID=3469 RepID=UPI000E6F77E5|nr:ATP-dependent RNA helicase drs1-like [Papaver somniferum]